MSSPIRYGYADSKPCTGSSRLNMHSQPLMYRTSSTLPGSPSGGNKVGIKTQAAPPTSTSNGNSPLQCSHPSHASVIATRVGELQLLDTEHYQRQLQRYRDQVAMPGSETANINGHLNEIFLKRLQEIDITTDGDSDLKLITYQEWVDMVLRINVSLINNIQRLELEIGQLLEEIGSKAALCSQGQDTELAKCRNDICMLLCLVQNGYHHHNWSLKGMRFETISPAQIFGLSGRHLGSVPEDTTGSVKNERPTADTDSAMQRNKLTDNIKALAIEMVEKQDATQEVKENMSCMKEEVQKAELQILLKDDAKQESPIASHINYLSSEGFRGATIPDSEYQAAFNGAAELESLSRMEQEKLKLLDEELSELFDVSKDVSKKHLEYHRKRLANILHNSEAEKLEAYRKLDFIRQQIIDLETSNIQHCHGDCETALVSKNQNYQDAKILLTLHRRIHNMKNCALEQTKHMSKLGIVNEDLSSQLKIEKSISNCNNQTLKEVADLLSSLTDEQFSYQDIYNTQIEHNPFCTAIHKLQSKFSNREKELLNVLQSREKKIKELESCIYENNSIVKQNSDQPKSYLVGAISMSGHSLCTLHSTDSRNNNVDIADLSEIDEEYRSQATQITEAHYSYLTMLGDLKSELDILSTEVTTVQQGFEECNGDGEQIFEESLQELISHNDLMQQALEQATTEKDTAYMEMTKFNENLECQIERLRCTIDEKEQCIVQLKGFLRDATHDLTTLSMVCNFCGAAQLTAAPERPRHATVAQYPQQEEELRLQLDQARIRIEALQSDLEVSQNQERQVHNEQRKLNDELLDSKRKINDLICHTRRLAALLKTQEAHRMDLSKKFELMEQSYSDQTKKLRKANGQLNMLHDRFNQMEQHNDKENEDSKLLHNEVLTLKEKEACLVGKLKSIQEHLIKSEKELYKAHDMIAKHQYLLQRNAEAHKDIVHHLQANKDSLLADYKNLQCDYKKHIEVCAQNEKIIESFRKWKEAQVQADAASRLSFNQYEEHIKLLLEEKQNFIEQYRDLRRDYCILQSEVERLKLCSLTSNSSGRGTLDSTMEKRLELLRRTYLRLVNKRTALQMGGDSRSQRHEIQQEPRNQSTISP